MADEVAPQQPQQQPLEKKKKQRPRRKPQPPQQSAATDAQLPQQQPPPPPHQQQWKRRDAPSTTDAEQSARQRKPRAPKQAAADDATAPAAAPAQPRRQQRQRAAPAESNAGDASVNSNATRAARPRRRTPRSTPTEPTDVQRQALAAAAHARATAPTAAIAQQLSADALPFLPQQQQPPPPPPPRHSHSHSHAHEHDHGHRHHELKATVDVLAPKRGLARRRVAALDPSVNTERATDIAAQLADESYECLICRMGVQRMDEVWNCHACYRVFHLTCVASWARKTESDSWSCPHCRVEITGMPYSMCFCGRPSHGSVDDLFNPHSCGQVCGHIRGVNCPHRCPQPCHPGPCPPCAAMGPERRCGCGRKDVRMRCGTAPEALSCGESCDQVLNCGIHKCARICHIDACGACTERADGVCHCGKRSETRACGDTRFSCEQVCGRPLDCGNHTCQRTCHAGPCAPCALTPARLERCPCGRVPSIELAPQRSSCTEPVPTCGRPCGRSLPCGHPCAEPCHIGDCPPCAVPVERLCRCSFTIRSVPCSTVEVLCETLCPEMRTCGRHRCDTVCCPRRAIGASHPCPLTCGKELQCRNHRCENPCHSGHCRPCLRIVFDEMSCPCGATVLEPPQPCGVRLPKCTHDCSVRRPCNHPVCHTCHPTSEACPPCTILTSRPCAGGHTTVHNVPCHMRKPSCGQTCGRPLACGRHTCAKRCHTGPCQKNRKAVGCSNACGLVRQCGHPCQAKCHPHDPCPDTKCTVNTEVYCPCRRRKVLIPCGEYIPLVKCDDDCLHLKRTHGLAEALGLLPSTATPAALASVSMREIVRSSGYSTFLLARAQLDPHLVKDVESHLLDMARGVGPDSLELDGLDGDQRRFVHELATIYGVLTSTSGGDTNRRLILTPSLAMSVPSHPLSFFIEPVRHVMLRIPNLLSAVRTADIERPLRRRELDQLVHIMWTSDTAVLLCENVRTKRAVMEALEGTPFAHVQEFAPSLPPPPPLPPAAAVPEHDAADVAAASASESSPPPPAHAVPRGDWRAQVAGRPFEPLVPSANAYVPPSLRAGSAAAAAASTTASGVRVRAVQRPEAEFDDGAFSDLAPVRVASQRAAADGIHAPPSVHASALRGDWATPSSASAPRRGSPPTAAAGTAGAGTAAAAAAASKQAKKRAPASPGNMFAALSASDADDVDA